MPELSLYAWEPNGHGQLSFMVVAPSEAEALQAVELEVAAERRGYEVEGWGTDYYQLTVYPAGKVMTHDND